MPVFSLVSAQFSKNDYFFKSMEEKLRTLTLQFSNYLEEKARLEDGKFYFEQQKNEREVAHYQMKLAELEQSIEGIQYNRLKKGLNEK